MPAPPLDLVSAYLIAEGVFGDPEGSTLDWPLYTTFEPDSDDTEDDCGAIYDTTALKDGRLMRTGKTIRHPGVMIKVRSLDYAEGWTKMEAVVTAMDAIRNTPVMVDGNPYTINAATLRTDINFLGVEPKGKRRNLFSVNYTLTTKEG